MKHIQLTKGQYAIVDDEFFDQLNQFKWCVSTLGYAVRRVGGRKNGRIEWMHRIVNQTPNGFFTDHINRNKLDNRGSNLRTVKHRDNSFNRYLQSNNTSGVKGVYWHKAANKWMSSIRFDGKQYHLGLYISFDDAVTARKNAESRLSVHFV